MYLIVSYDRFYKYPKMFTTFMHAFMIYEILNDENNIIEYYDKFNNRQIVWKSDYEKKRMNVDYNMDTSKQKFKQ